MMMLLLLLLLLLGLLLLLRLCSEGCVLTDVPEFPCCCDAVCRPLSADRTQPVTENSAAVVTSSLQSVTKVTDRGQKPITTVAERR